jgi:hypothetical protein
LPAVLAAPWPLQAQQQTIATLVTVLSPPSPNMVVRRGLDFGALTAGAAPTVVAPSTNAGSTSALVELTGFNRNVRRVTVTVTFPTALTRIPSPGDTLPMSWDGESLRTCTGGAGGVGACDGETSSRLWTIPAAPAGGAEYTHTITICHNYASAGDFACANGGQGFMDNSVYLAIGGRAVPSAQQATGIYQGWIRIVQVSTN